MIKRLLLVVALGVTLSGCFMAPLALIGPMSSGFTTASIIQSGVTSGASYIIKQTSGKSISEVGVIPDIEIIEEPKDFKINTETDNQLNFALKLLDG